MIRQPRVPNRGAVLCPVSALCDVSQQHRGRIGGVRTIGPSVPAPSQVGQHHLVHFVWLAALAPVEGVRDDRAHTLATPTLPMIAHPLRLRP